MLEHSLRLSLDVIFPPPTHYPNSQKYLAPDNVLDKLMYELIFDEIRDSGELLNIFDKVEKVNLDVGEDKDVY
jgi:hypothetical protein